MTTYQQAIHALRDLVGADTTFTQAESSADSVFAASDGKPAVIEIHQDGTHVILPFATSELASSGYDAVVNAPGTVWYVALYDKSKSPTAPFRIDETYFGGMQVTQTTTQTITKKGPIWPWIVGLGTAALFFFGVGKRKR